MEKKEQLIKIKENQLFKKVGAHYNQIWKYFTITQVVAIIASYVLKLDFFILNVLFAMTLILMVTFLKEGAKKEDRGNIIKNFNINAVLLVLNFVHYIVITGIIDIFKNINSPAIALIVFVIADIASLVTMIILLKSAKFKEKIANIAEKSIFEEMIGEEIQSGDAILGIEQETGKPYILPFNERFLHLLALGATGTGKTSMTLTPMAWRDIQNPDIGLTCLEPKGDYAETVWGLVQVYNEGKPENEKRKCTFFDPIARDCPFFNPLYGNEIDVIENMATTFRMFGSDSSQFFQDSGETLLRNALKVLKRWEQRHPNGREVTLIDLSSLLHGAESGIKILDEFSKITTRNDDEARDHYEVYIWFKTDYLSGVNRDNKGVTKSYENTSLIRTQLTKLNSNQYLRRVLNPKPEDVDKPRLDFAKALAEKEVLAISTCQGTLQDLGTFLGYFIMLAFQSSVFNRPGNVDTRPAHILQIDEFQTYSNSKFEIMLTQGRSYKVSSVLATQNRSLIGANVGSKAKQFVDMVSTNARNVVVYPGANYEDAAYYSRQFGEKVERKIDRSISRPVNNPLYGLSGIGRRPNESLKEVEKNVPRFTPNDITYRPFKEAVVGTLKKNSMQVPVVLELDFIEREVKNKVDQYVADYVAEQRGFDINEIEQHTGTRKMLANSGSTEDDEEEFNFSEPNNVSFLEKAKVNPIKTADLSVHSNQNNDDDEF